MQDIVVDDIVLCLILVGVLKAEAESKPGIGGVEPAVMAFLGSRCMWPL